MLNAHSSNLKMLSKRVKDLDNAFQRIEQRLHRLEIGQTQPLAPRQRCEDLYARQTAVLQRLLVLGGAQDQTDNIKQGSGSQQLAIEQNEVSRSREAQLSQELELHSIKSYKFTRVPSNYYDQDLEYRRNCLQAASIQHLCKSLIIENTHMPEDQCSDTPQNSRYYLVVIQYAARFHGEKLKRYIHKLNGKLGIQYFRLTFAAPDVSERISGYAHGSVTPVGIKTSIPVILSHKITKLSSSFFWMGGGEEDLKLGMAAEDFILGYNPLVVDCTY